MKIDPKNNIRILIADDHLILRMGLVTLLENAGGLTVVGEAENGEEAIRLARKTTPDVVIMDLVMPGMDGAEATAHIKECNPKVKVLILTTFSTSDILSKALANGADGILLKNAPKEELLDTLRSVAQGGHVVSQDVQEIIAADPPAPTLSPRQKEILDLIVRGFTNADIANRFGISLTVVKEHLTALYSKIDAANRTEAVAIALRKHLLKI